jgi:galactokinase
MPTIAQVNTYLASHNSEQYQAVIYDATPSVLTKQRNRYSNLLDQFHTHFPEQNDVDIFSAPGRTEVGGNHTDHNAGRVLAAAVNLDALAVAAKNNREIITIYSEGYPLVEINTQSLDLVEREKNTSSALIRGICARLKQLGFNIGGIDAYVTSAVPKGSGLSSSAAYEILFVTILNELYNQGRVDPVTCAKIGQYAENKYFGKPCGLMDQTTSAVGGFVTIDFKDFENPIVQKVDFDFASSGFSLVIVDSGGSHADLTDEYAACASEMKSIARAFGGSVLRQIPMEKVLDNIHQLRTETVNISDRAILRAFHFYADDQRVVDQVLALQHNDFKHFLDLVNESGRSSWMLLQNCYTTQGKGNAITQEQGVCLALALSENTLKPRGAWRVHGGGFAGTIQAFVPNDLLAVYIKSMELVFGIGSCQPLKIRPVGAVKIPLL